MPCDRKIKNKKINKSWCYDFISEVQTGYDPNGLEQIHHSASKKNWVIKNLINPFRYIKWGVMEKWGVLPLSPLMISKKVSGKMASS